MGAKTKKIRWLLFAILALAIFLRVFNIKDTLLFHFDQGYHGLAIREIWENKSVKLLGHKTDVDGIYHSSIFYYSMLPLYLLSSWDPAGVSTSLALFDGLAVIFIFLTAKRLFNNKVGFIAALLYAVSYSAISYSRWLSNVTPIPLLSSVVLYFLARSRGNSVKDFSCALLIGGLIAQFNGAIGFFFLPLFLAYALYFRKGLFKRKVNLLIYVFAYLIPQIPLVLFDLRHDFLVTSSIYRHFLEGGSLSVSSGGVLTNLRLLLNEMLNIFSYKISVVGLIILFWVVYAISSVWKNKDKATKNVKLLFCGALIMFLGLAIYQGINGFFMVGLIPFLVIIAAWSIDALLRKKETKLLGLVVIISVVIINLYHFRGFFKPGFNLVPIGTSNLITLQDRIRAIDFMYRVADGDSFKTEKYIIPYYQEQPWGYLFKSYALKKYNYLPSENGSKTFIIYEPDYDYDYRLQTWLEEKTEKYGERNAVFKSNSLIVEEREK